MISRIACWLGFHDWGCLYRHKWQNSGSLAGSYSETTGWVCHRCNKNKTEQWDG